MSTPTINGAAVHSPAYATIAGADRTWCRKSCDDQLDEQRITHLATAVQQLVDAVPTGVNLAEVGQMRQANTELSSELATGRQMIEQLLGQLARLVQAVLGEDFDPDLPVGPYLDQAVETISGTRAELATARADYATLAGERSQIAAANTRLTQEVEQLRTEVDSVATEIATAHRDNAELADDLATARSTLQGHVEAVTAALTERDRLLEELDAAQRHRCQWEWNPATGEYFDCECGRPWPRYGLDEGEPIEPELEPLEALMARVRAEAAGWGEDS